MLAEATELRVDYFLPKPFAFEALFDRMRGAAAQSARSALHPPSLLVTSILHELGMSPGLKGYGYIHDAALLALDDPSLLHAVTKVIYPCVARRNGTTAFCVERTIRHAIEITWERGSRDAWNRYFGHLCADGGKPANGMFLAELVEALKYEKLGGARCAQPSFSNSAATSASRSRICRCCGQTFSHLPQRMQSEALPPFLV